MATITIPVCRITTGTQRVFAAQERNVKVPAVGVMKTKYLVLVFLASLIFLQARPALALRCDETEPKFSRYGLVWTLKEEGFSNALDVYVEFQRLGNIKVNEQTCFTFYYYTREFPAASNVHYSTRLLVFKNWNYVGMYGTDGSKTPEIDGNAIVFRGEFESWKTAFDQDDPPIKVYIQGKSRSLLK
jgi:hypothetical protein